MASPSGKCYNNPAFCNQFDSSLYDYEYIPEIDPDSPEIRRREQTIKLVHPRLATPDFQENSSEFEESDESNRSIIVEECNNRRITLICEKRKQEGYYEDEKCAYYQDISLESENGFKELRKDSEKTRGSQIQRKEINHEARNANAMHYGKPMDSASEFQRQQLVRGDQPPERPPRPHRYEEIHSDSERDGWTQGGKNNSCRRPVHRYAEISTDENGYPSLENEVEVLNHFYVAQPWESRREPRTISPNYLSPTFHPSQTYQRTISPHPSDFEYPSSRLRPNSPSTSYTNSPPIEMSDFSPPRRICRGQGESFDYPFIPRGQNNSSFRQPPVGASPPVHLQEKSCRSVLTKNLHKIIAKPKARSPPKQEKWNQMFSAKTTKTPKTSTPRVKIVKESGTMGTSTRRNISSAFHKSAVDLNKPQQNFSMSPITKLSNPYKSTTQELPRTTAVITPMLQRKKSFQSTGNIIANPIDQPQTIIGVDGKMYKVSECLEEVNERTRIKRNQSVPNFTQTFLNERTPRKPKEFSTPKKDTPIRRLEYQYSPAKSIGGLSPLNRSRLSLLDQLRSSWSNLGSDVHTPPTGCLIVAAIIQLLTGIAICSIGFYLLSRLGRRYYLDFGILAGCVSLVLGCLGFRAQSWRWLPNRNYVSGYIVLGAFSVLTCAGLVLLITVRPMAGDPLLDVTGGAICGVSVLIICMAVTGLTMSGCCKTPPPDNRVTNL